MGKRQRKAPNLSPTTDEGWGFCVRVLFACPSSALRAAVRLADATALCFCFCVAALVVRQRASRRPKQHRITTFSACLIAVEVESSLKSLQEREKVDKLAISMVTRRHWEARIGGASVMTLLCLLLSFCQCSAFQPLSPFSSRSFLPHSLAFSLKSTSLKTEENTETPDYNGVHVEKTGGMGAVTASQQALERNLSLGAPRARPTGGHYLTRGGIQVTAHVEDLEFSSNRHKKNTSAYAMEQLVRQLDDHRGVVLTSSYEFPGRYARWSLGFVDPPLEISGRGTELHIQALNARGRLILPAIQTAMETLKSDGILESVVTSLAEEMEGTGDEMEGLPTRIDVKVVPPPEVGTFSEEERSRQVCAL